MIAIRSFRVHRVLAALVAVAVPLVPSAQDAVRVQPRSYQVVFENSEIRAIRYSSLPGMGVCGTGVHTHPRHLTIALTPARVRVRVDGKTIIAENKAGDVFYGEAVRHEAENISGSGTTAILIEFKHPLSK